MTNDPQLRREVKAQAKLCVMSRLIPCAAAYVICWLPMMALSLITTINTDDPIRRMVVMFVLALLGEIFLINPLNFGLENFYICRTRGLPKGLEVIFSVFSDAQTYWRGFKMGLCLSVRSILWMLVPSALYIGFAFWLASGVDLSKIHQVRMIFYLATAVFLIATLPIGAKLMSYRAGYMEMFDDPSIGAWRATRQGARLFRGRIMELLAFQLSFLPWVLVITCTCGLGILFVMPYMGVAFYLYVSRLKYGNRIADGFSVDENNDTTL